MMAEAGFQTVALSASPRYAFLDIRVDSAELKRIEAELRGIPGGMARAVPPALNAAAREERTWLYQQFCSRLNIARKTSVRDRLELRPRASPFNWSAGIRIALSRFTVAGFKGVRQTRRGVTWSPVAGQSRLIPRAFVRGGFTHYRSGEYIEARQVWRRAERAGRMMPRYPIQVMRGPSLAYVFAQDPGFQGQAERTGSAILSKKLDQQVNRLLAKLK
jgi:hypothetical protein